MIDEKPLCGQRRFYFQSVTEKHGNVSHSYLKFSVLTLSEHLLDYAVLRHRKYGTLHEFTCHPCAGCMLKRERAPLCCHLEFDVKKSKAQGHRLPFITNFISNYQQISCDHNTKTTGSVISFEPRHRQCVYLYSARWVENKMTS